MRMNSSMNFDIRISSYFAHEAKRLSKHYPSFKNDYSEFLKSLKEDPYQGDDLGNGVRKDNLQGERQIRRRTSDYTQYLDQ